MLVHNSSTSFGHHAFTSLLDCLERGDFFSFREELKRVRWQVTGRREAPVEKGELRVGGGIVAGLPRRWKPGSAFPATSVKWLKEEDASRPTAFRKVAFREEDNPKEGLYRTLLVEESWAPGEEISLITWSVSTEVMDGRCWDYPDMMSGYCSLGGDDPCPGCRHY